MRSADLDGNGAAGGGRGFAWAGPVADGTADLLRRLAFDTDGGEL